MIDVPAGTRLVLASGSPRRAELLGAIGLSFVVRAADIDESLAPDEAPDEYVLRLAAAKAAAVATPGEIVVGADTTVEVDGVILGKPAGDHDARAMLRRLSGRAHRVHTGVTVLAGSRRLERLVTTSVRFVPLTADVIEWYVATGEPADKAGGYAIQGAGGALVAGVDGSVSNVIGLPLAETVALLRTVLAAPTA